MRRARVVQQYVMTASDGGLKTEYEALSSRKALSDYYEFVPVVLNNCHCGISLSDIRFYRNAIREADPDIVHIRGAGMESLNAVLGAKLSGRGKVLVTVHGLPIIFTKRQRDSWRTIITKSFPAPPPCWLPALSRKSKWP